MSAVATRRNVPGARRSANQILYRYPDVSVVTGVTGGTRQWNVYANVRRQRWLVTTTRLVRMGSTERRGGPVGCALYGYVSATKAILIRVRRRFFYPAFYGWWNEEA